MVEVSLRALGMFIMIKGSSNSSKVLPQRVENVEYAADRDNAIASETKERPSATVRGNSAAGAHRATNRDTSRRAARARKTTCLAQCTTGK